MYHLVKEADNKWASSSMLKKSGWPNRPTDQERVIRVATKKRTVKII